MLKPPALNPGDRIGIVAPAGGVDGDRLRAGAEALAAIGYTPVVGESVLNRDGYFAGSTEDRVRDFISMLRREDIQAILCARGGYGANYLLEALESVDILASPKLLIGYSDVTTLLTRFVDRGLACLHGPMLAADFALNKVEMTSFRAAVTGQPVEFAFAAEEVSTLVPGNASGVLYGGCLSLLVASLGTPYEIQTQDKILFMEDVNVWPYQFDRMLRQLQLAGKFDRVRAIIFGEMLNCGSAECTPGTRETAERIVGALGIPLAYGLRSGHVSGSNLTLPLGVEADVSFTADRVHIHCAPATQKP